MIVFDLQCGDGGERFEGWFRSNADFDEQLEASLVECPYCRSKNIAKAPMAPRLPRKGGSDDPARLALSRLAELQQKLLAGSEWVGDSFAKEARAMHLGEVEQRPVHGKATVEEARSLTEEGVPLMPLPLPVVPPGQVN